MIKRSGKIVCSKGDFRMPVEKFDDIEYPGRGVGREILVIIGLLSPEHQFNIMKKMTACTN